MLTFTRRGQADFRREDGCLMETDIDCTVLSKSGSGPTPPRCTLNVWHVATMQRVLGKDAVDPPELIEV
eukprot:CAMPEP_0172941162 /NCGR_PEP_ID=MMETSP1075-20121228/224401_1 /TAXON_ID=2916 /ORGANISM="Ceratium fusus, Strain PA161109" /LENGTH=68 /DNA_ID=CAMNT_0013802573 /DNA_START=279 /DNA_END=485 /DNA_ORIENTATION=+